MIQIFCSAFRGMKNLLSLPSDHGISELLVKERLVARYAQGNVHLQTGKYMTAKDVEEYKISVLSRA